MENDFTKSEIETFMKLALLEGEKGFDNREVPVGCVFVDVKSKKVVVRAHNLTNCTKNATTHAEINCINALYNKEPKEGLLEGYSLFVTCEPCIMCAEAIRMHSLAVNRSILSLLWLQ